MRCVIADFGLTAVKSQGYLNSFCGSPAWTAPEILRSQPYDEKADIYSLGIVFWEIFTKTPPYHGMQANGIIAGGMFLFH
jgi:serine/threonine protein kinase